eukprot:scaffold113341_cov20-Tisochrysis_lutea.AAC.1
MSEALKTALCKRPSDFCCSPITADTPNSLVTTNTALLQPPTPTNLACEWGRLRLELCDRATITSCNCTRSSYLAQPSAVPGTAGARCCQVPCPTRSGQHLGARPPAAHECRQRNRNGFLDAMLREGRIKQHPRAHPPAVDE